MRIKSISRRMFLAKSSVGMASFSILKNTKKAGKKTVRPDSRDIIHRELGRTGIKIPVVSMGVMNSDNPALIKKAYEAGIRHFDTAWFYQRGNNERIVGQVIKDLGVRDNVIIATKILINVGPRWIRQFSDFDKISIPSGKTREEFLKEEFLGMFSQSLERLQMDYVDILYLHNVEDPAIIDYAPYKEAISQLKDEKKIKFSGVSTHKNEIAILEKMSKMKFYDIALVANCFKYERRDKIKKAMRKAYESGIAQIIMKTQGVVDWMHGDPETHHTAALKWALQDEFVTTAVPGFTTFEQLEEDFSVVYDLNFTEDEKKYLNDFKNFRYGVNIQCQQCGECLNTCAKKADVPDLMRTYMYAAGYKNFVHSRLTYESISPENNLLNCLNCDSCMAKCPNGINIPSNIDNLKAIFC